MIERPGGWSVFSRSRYRYEVLRNGTGAVDVVDQQGLLDAFGPASRDSRRDWQECETTAGRLFSEGSTEQWVQYPTAAVVSTDRVREIASRYPGGSDAPDEEGDR